MNVYRKVSRSAATWLCAALLAAATVIVPLDLARHRAASR